LNRRDFLIALLGTPGLIGLWSSSCKRQEKESSGVLVNDVHTKLNPTIVDHIVYPDSLESIQKTITDARLRVKPVCIAGTRHAMGAQQFATDGVLIGMTSLSRVVDFNSEKGTIDVEAGIRWPQVIGYLLETQKGHNKQWGIAQKQTSDWISIGGSLGSNIHGRGLNMKPFIQDIDSFILLDSSGNTYKCGRSENPELLRLAIGGYGLFGVVYSIKLRLLPRQKVERVAKLIDIEDLMTAFEKYIENGYTYGTFLYSSNPESDDFLRKGVLLCYRPVNTANNVPDYQEVITAEEWVNSRYLAHAKKDEFFEKVLDYYTSTSGTVYWSDTHQLGMYIYDYHQQLDSMLGSKQATDIPTEIYVPPKELVGFLEEVRKDFRKNHVDIIIGEIGVIAKDEESFLAYAKQPYARISIHIHTEHNPEDLERSRQAHRRLIDMAIQRGGSYYLTNHRFANPYQLEACYPQFSEFLRLKKKYDPEELFQSDWYRHYKNLVEG